MHNSSNSFILFSVSSISSCNNANYLSFSYNYYELAFFSFNKSLFFSKIFLLLTNYVIIFSNFSKVSILYTRLISLTSIY